MDVESLLLLKLQYIKSGLLLNWPCIILQQLVISFSAFQNPRSESNSNSNPIPNLSVCRHRCTQCNNNQTVHRAMSFTR